MDFDSSINQSTDRFTIDRQGLERAFLSLFDQLTGVRQKSTPGRNRDGCCNETKRHCCCCGNRNEVPSFSVLLGNTSTQSCSNAHGRTAGNNGKILQIHLPETSTDPCQILITSHRQEVTVKYLQQGQQFTFSTNDSDSTLPKQTTASVYSDRHLSKRDDDQMFSNRKKNRVFSNSRNDDEMFSNTSTVDNEAFDSASKSPMSVTIDRVFSKAQIDRVFSNVDNDRILSDRSNNRIMSNEGHDGVILNSDTNRTLSNETNRMMSNAQTNRRLSNAMNDHIFPSTESDPTHSNLEKVHTDLPNDNITDSSGFLQTTDDTSMARNATNTSPTSAIATHSRNEKTTSLTFVSERNIPRPYDQVGLPRRLSTSSESLAAEKQNCNSESNNPPSGRARNSLDPSSARARNSLDASSARARSSLDPSSASLNKLDDDDDSSDFPPAKKQKKQSLNTFIDSLLTKRTEEESRKSLDHFSDEGTSNRVDKRRSFELTRPLDLQQADTAKGGTNELVIVDPSEPVATLFSSDTLQDTESITQSLSPSTGDTDVFSKPEPNKIHTKKTRFKCQYCSAMFQERNDCLLHISKEHMEERPHKCKLCNATFKKTRSLRYHIRHHNGERPYKCTYCEKAFKEKYHLTVHIRTHTNERPFACMQCGKAFKQTNELTSHIRTHSGERPHKCDICNKSFKRKRQLYNHNLIHLHAIAMDTAKSQNDVVVSIDRSIAPAQHDKPLERHIIE